MCVCVCVWVNCSNDSIVDCFQWLGLVVDRWSFFVLAIVVCFDRANVKKKKKGIFYFDFHRMSRNVRTKNRFENSGWNEPKDEKRKTKKKEKKRRKIPWTERGERNPFASAHGNEKKKTKQKMNRITKTAHVRTSISKGAGLLTGSVSFVIFSPALRSLSSAPSVALFVYLVLPSLKKLE